MSAEFEPVRLGPSRRRIDPLAIGVIAVVVALGVAVVKPWESGPDGNAPAPSAAAVARPAASDARRLRVARPRPTYASWPRTRRRGPDIQPIVTPHDAWGVRAIVADERGLAAQLFGASGQLSERWAPAAVASDGTGIAYLGTR